MSYQKLNTSRAWKVLPNDDTPLPNIGGPVTIQIALDAVPVVGTNINFVQPVNDKGIEAGMVVVNITTGVQTLVTGVNQSANITQLPVESVVGMNAGDTIVIYEAVTSRSAAVLYVGTGGNVRVLTAGGDSPGLNAAIRGVGKAGIGAYDTKIVGFKDGFRGLMENRTIRLNGSVLSGILTMGGTILGTSRDKPHKMVVGSKVMDMTNVIIENYHKKTFISRSILRTEQFNLISA